MKNNILALLIMACGIIGVWGKVGRKTVLALLSVILILLAFVSVDAAKVNDFGPAVGVAAFVLSFGLIFLFRRRS
ncbi:MAG: hypothetical protein K2X27_00005 [Candidatus Obscuribacterales bacterium]|nr:hypothetical protein [Candidatus Obscuribacterales bacterium]